MEINYLNLFTQYLYLAASYFNCETKLMCHRNVELFVKTYNKLFNMIKSKQRLESNQENLAPKNNQK